MLALSSAKSSGRIFGNCQAVCKGHPGDLVLIAPFSLAFEGSLHCPMNHYIKVLCHVLPRSDSETRGAETHIAGFYNLSRPACFFADTK
jgi:hypothetical protein